MLESAEIGHKISKQFYARNEPHLREALLNAQFDLSQTGRGPVLIILSVGRKQLHDPIDIVHRHMPDRSRSEAHRLSDLEFVRFQHGSLKLKHPSHPCFVQCITEFS